MVERIEARPTIPAPHLPFVSPSGKEPRISANERALAKSIRSCGKLRDVDHRVSTCSLTAALHRVSDGSVHAHQPPLASEPKLEIASPVSLLSYLDPVLRKVCFEG